MYFLNNLKLSFTKLLYNHIKLKQLVFIPTHSLPDLNRCSSRWSQTQIRCTPIRWAHVFNTFAFALRLWRRFIRVLYKDHKSLVRLRRRSVVLTYHSEATSLYQAFNLQTSTEQNVYLEIFINSEPDTTQTHTLTPALFRRVGQFSAFSSSQIVCVCVDSQDGCFIVAFYHIRPSRC